MALYFNDYTHQSSFGGDTFCGRYASGTVVKVFPGLGLLVENDNYKYLIVSNFEKAGKMSFHYLETIPSDYTYKNLSDETILFWLKGGIPTKSCIYGSEIKRRILIEPNSNISLNLPTKVNPIISPNDYYNSISSEDWNFLKQTGSLPIEPSDMTSEYRNFIKQTDTSIENKDDVPITRELYLKRELDRQTNQWHLLRSCALTEIHAMPSKYTFLQSGKKLLIEMNGKKMSTVNYSGNNINLYTLYTSIPCSPADPVVIDSPTPSMDKRSDLSEEPDNQFTESVKRLTSEEIDEGIEEAHWEMKRLRKHGENHSKAIIQTQKWVDAAYDEKQLRRENNFVGVD